MNVHSLEERIKRTTENGQCSTEIVGCALVHSPAVGELFRLKASGPFAQSVESSSHASVHSAGCATETDRSLGLGVGGILSRAGDELGDEGSSVVERR